MSDNLGVINDAGIRVEEVPVKTEVIPSSVGNSAFLGLFEKGSTTELNQPVGSDDFVRQMGSYVSWSQDPDVGIDFYDHAKGAGAGYFNRITDGTDIKSARTIYGMELESVIPFQAKTGVRSEVMTATAKSSGRWGGKKADYSGLLLNTGALTNTTIDISNAYPALLKNQLKDGWLILTGNANKVRKILSNTVGGICLIESDQKMLDEFVGTDYSFFIYLENKDSAGLDKGVDIVLKAGKVDFDYNFGMDIKQHGKLVNTFPDLSMDVTDEDSAENLVNDKSDNYEVDLDVTWEGSITPQSRPGVAYIPTAIAQNSITVRILDYDIIIGTANGYLSDVSYGTAVIEDVLQIDFSSPTAFTVTSLIFKNLIAGTVGSTWTSGHTQGIDFKINTGTLAFANGNRMIIHVRPMIVNAMKDSLVYPDAFGSNRRFNSRCTDNTKDTMNFRSLTDLRTICTLATAGTVEGTVAGTSVAAVVTGSVDSATFDTTTNKTLEYEINGILKTPISVTSGATTPIATVISDLNAGFGGLIVATMASTNKVRLTMAAAGALSSFKILDGNLNIALGYTDNQTFTGTTTFDTTTNKTFNWGCEGVGQTPIVVTSGGTTPIATIITDLNTGFAGKLIATYTTAYKIVITHASCGHKFYFKVLAGNLNTGLGFTDNQTFTGVDGTVVRIECPISLKGGYDGIEDIDDQDYINEFDVDNSKFNDLSGKHLGEIKVCACSRTTLAVQQALLVYAKANKWSPRIIFPTTVVTNQAAEEFVNSTFGRDGCYSIIYPSFGYYQEPVTKIGTKLTCLSGAIMGIEARYARDWEGFHKASTDTKAILEKLKSLQVLDRDIKGEFLSPLGIQYVKRQSTSYCIWGDENPAVNMKTDDRWKHKREVMNHYIRTIFESYDDKVFAINDTSLWGEIKNSLCTFFDDEVRKGALVKKGAYEPYYIKVDAENNPAYSQDQGKVIVEIGVTIVNCAKQIIFRIGPSASVVEV